MQGKTVVITGGTSGIGEVAAVALAKMGARIVLVGRDRSRGDATLGRLRSSAPGLAHSAYFADLSRLAHMKRVAAEIADQEPRIDVLINNAGAIFSTRQLTEDGLERTFALNHMAYFVLTEGLRQRLSASGAARIVNTASEAHRGATLDFDDLQLARGYGAVKASRRTRQVLLKKEIAPEAEKALGIKLDIETINGNDLQARTTSAIQSGVGPDVICGLNNWPQLYAESVANVDDVRFATFAAAAAS